MSIPKQMSTSVEKLERMSTFVTVRFERFHRKDGSVSVDEDSSVCGFAPMAVDAAAPEAAVAFSTPPRQRTSP